MAARRSKRRQINEINVVPYIDVMLVLLIIFMITAPLISPGQIDLPEIGKSLAPPVDPLEVIIKADGSLAFRDRTVSAKIEPIEQDQLITLIQQKQTENAEQPVVVAGDKAVRYEVVMNVMDLLQQHNVKKVGLLARQK